MFNLQERKDYVKGLREKYEMVRQTLQEFEAKQKALDEQQTALERQIVYEKFGQRYHHLLGTSRIPGILAKQDTFPDPKTISLSNLPERAIRTSFSVQSYVRNSKRPFPNKYLEIMKHDVDEAVSEEANQKYAKGPFLVS